MRSIPTVIASDAEDVIWALQTADALWKREERVDAIVWLRRAAQAAGEAEDDDRALTLARDAAELAEWIAQNPGIDDADVQDAPTTAPPAAGEAVDDLLRGPGDAIPMDEPTPVVDIAITMAPPSVAPSPPAPRSPVPPVPRSPLPPVLQSAPPAPGHVPTAAEAHAGMLDPWGDAEAPTRNRPITPPPVPVASSPPPLRAFESDEVVTSAPPVPPPAAESKAPAEVRAAVAPAPPRPPPRPGGPPPTPSRVQPPPLRAEPPPLEPPTPSPTASRAAPASPGPKAAPRAPPPKPAAQPPRETPPQTAPKPPREAQPQAAPLPPPEAQPQAAPTPASQVPPEPPALDGNLDPALESALEAAAQPEPPAAAQPEPPAASEPTIAAGNGVDLSQVEALSDLPDDARDAFASAAKVQTLGREDEVSAFALALVLEGEVDVAATIVDAPAQRMSAGAVLRARGTIEPIAAVRLIGASATARVATWDEQSVTEAFRTCPWVEDELRAAGNRLQALVGITMGPLGERLDPSLRADVMSRLQLRALAEHEVITTRGAATVGLLVVGGGELEMLGEDGNPNGTVLGPGEFLFPNESLRAAPAPSTVRAATGGALVLLAERGVAQELLVTCPPLLEIFAGM